MHKSFDHDGFSTICDRFVGPQLISYNSSQLIKERFKDYEVSEFDLTLHHALCWGVHERTKRT